MATTISWELATRSRGPANLDVGSWPFLMVSVSDRAPMLRSSPRPWAVPPDYATHLTQGPPDDESSPPGPSRSLQRVDATRRQAIIDVLGNQSGGELHGFFTAHRLANAYENSSNRGYGRQKKVADALAAADHRGDLDDVLLAAGTRFGLTTTGGAAVRPPSKVRHDLEDLAEELLAWEERPEESVVRDWIARFNRILPDVEAHVGDTAPDPVDLPLGVIDDNERLLPAGRRRLSGATRRALEALGSATGIGVTPLNDAVKRLHPHVRSVAEPLLTGGHGDNAVEEACKTLAQRVREMSGLGTDGTALMNAALTPNAPKIRLNLLISESDRSEQQGFMGIAAGLMLAARNPRAHRPAGDYDEDEILDLLAAVSLVHRRLDTAGGGQSPCRS